ncbi:tail fiber assembly protein [Orbaceae bacterium ESL0721]|nr:tail fiber assembly protein [Orbaceae bacterium ESL0721]
MKYYKDSNNTIFAYEDDVPEFGTPDAEYTIGKGLIKISKEDALSMINKPLTEEQIKENNKYIKNDLLFEANKKIEIIQDIIELNMQEADEEEQLKEWKKYRILLTRLDLTDPNIIWPEKPKMD